MINVPVHTDSSCYPPRSRGGLARIAISFARKMALALTLIVGSIIPAAALDFPALTGRVVDQANILNAQNRQELTDKLAALETKTGSQLVVVTLKSLQGTSIEEFGVQLGRHWKIGQGGKNNGALLIVAPTERKVRVEVGYGLEGTLTDALTKFIIENSILPRFRAADFPGGVKRGVDDLITLVQGEGEDIKQRAVAQQATPADPMSDWTLIAVFLFIVGMVGITFYAIFRQVFRDVRNSRRSARKNGWISYLPASSSLDSSWSSSSSSSDSGFSGGGGSFGGGGSSGSW
jgi:uncharacterized protein